jgi:predicted glycogen debranching enzyme
MPDIDPPPGALRPDGSFVLDTAAGLDALRDTEWLLTTGLGGFAMGSALGMPTRRYHALLIASAQPPTHRVLALAQVADTLLLRRDDDDARIDLATFAFRNLPLHPDGHTRLLRFEKGLACRWVFDIRGHEVVRELTLGEDEERATLRWILPAPLAGCAVEATPLVALRDFHALLTERTAPRYQVDADTTECVVATGGSALRLISAGGLFTRDSHWWRDLEYAVEARRGFPACEDLYAPGRFRLTGEPQPDGTAICELIAAFEPPSRAPARPRRRDRINRAAEAITSRAPKSCDPAEASALAQAADDFIVRRRTRAGWATTILAGYPWFADWGRDTMIALPGLLLATGRTDEAGETLRLFAAHLRNGLIPNRFDDYTDDAHYNTADATLWFVHACCEHARAAGAFDPDLADAVLTALEAHARSETPDIWLDPADHLLIAGGPATQLTWMDAKTSAGACTPRHGKPVEINALWIHGLRSACELLARRDHARCAPLDTLAARAGESFVRRFWSPENQWLADRLEPGDDGSWTPAWERRPNQVIAAALRHAPLTIDQRHAVVALADRDLFTPFGLRTLAPGERAYRARYEGGPDERDSAYHNGTAWPWLLGPWAEATLRSENFSDDARARVRAALAPMRDRLRAGCLGQLAEIFDAEGSQAAPQRARGCPAQAWSVAELIRALVLCDSKEP